MLNANPESHQPEADEAAVERIVASGAARGALTLVAIATSIVMATWFAFYLFVFLPRAIAP